MLYEIEPITVTERNNEVWLWDISRVQGEGFSSHCAYAPSLKAAVQLIVLSEKWREALSRDLRTRAT